MATLSLCMIVKNEERWLPQCLEAAKPFVDEIIVADTGSRDKTVEIAVSAGATVVSIPWEHDFSKARNAALAKATKDWILVLDADERIAPEDFTRLRTLIAETPADALKLELRNYVQNAGPGCVACIPGEVTMHARAYRPFRLVRLVRNKGFRYEGRVHEMLEPSIGSKNGSIADAQIPIHHYGILGAAKTGHKLRYYGWLVFKQLEDDPKNVRALHMAGQFSQERDDVPKALEYFRKTAERDPTYRNVWFTIAHLHLARKEPDKAIHAFEQSLLNNPGSVHAPQAINNLAVLYGAVGRRKDAAQLLELGMKKFPDDLAIRKNVERFGMAARA